MGFSPKSGSGKSDSDCYKVSHKAIRVDRHPQLRGHKFGAGPSFQVFTLIINALSITCSFVRQAGTFIRDIYPVNTRTYQRWRLENCARTFSICTITI